MVHSYLKMDDEEYQVGQWLLNPQGHHQFAPMFSVPNLKQAMSAVNTLNGGTRVSPDALHIFKEK